jgi:predicted membrane protein
MGDIPKVYITSILNDIRRKMGAAEFDGGAITSFLGSVDLDLRESRMDAGQVSLEITNLPGSIYIYPAADWDVSLNITEIAGKVKDYHKKTTGAKSKGKLLRISGVTFMGNVYIR